MRHLRSIAAILVLSVTLGVVPAVAQSGKAKSKGRAAKDHAAAGHQKAVPASEAEIRIFREYYAVQSVKPKPLPPGIAKNLARGKPLPPGIAQTRLPADLLAKLPVRPGYEWMAAGDVVVLIDPIGVVVDILREIF